MIFVRGTPPLFSVEVDMTEAPVIHEFASRNGLRSLTTYGIELGTDFTLELVVKLLRSPPSLGYQLLFEAGGGFDGFSLSISPRHEFVFSMCSKGAPTSECKRIYACLDVIGRHGVFLLITLISRVFYMSLPEEITRYLPSPNSFVPAMFAPIKEEWYHRKQLHLVATMTKLTIEPNKYAMTFYVDHQWVASEEHTADDMTFAISGPGDIAVFSAPASAGAQCLMGAPLYATAGKIRGARLNGEVGVRLFVGEAWKPTDRCEEEMWCLHGGTCSNGTQVVPGCICEPGYGGLRCEHDVDECVDASVCGLNEHCVNTYGSYECPCVAGYVRQGPFGCVEDTVSPVLHTCGNLRFNLSSDESTFVWVATANATDNSGEVTEVCAPPILNFMASGVLSSTCTATDPADNIESCLVIVTVADVTDPVFTACPASTVVANIHPDALTVTVPYSAVAQDNVGVTRFNCSHPSPVTLGHSSTFVTCTAEDAAGNVATCGFQIEVVDATPPRLTCPSGTIMAEYQGENTVVSYNVSATNATGGAVVVTCIPPTPVIGGLGLTTVNCLASGGLPSSTCDFAVSVVDTTEPSLDCPSNFTRNLLSNADAVNVFYRVTASDHDDSTEVACTKNNSFVASVGSTTVECSATDSSGNRATCIFFVTVFDVTAPVLDCRPPDSMQIIDDKGADTVPALYTASAEDAVDGTVVPVCNVTLGEPLAPGTHVVACVAQDAASNQGACVFSITVHGGAGNTSASAAGSPVAAAAGAACGVLVLVLIAAMVYRRRRKRGAGRVRGGADTSFQAHPGGGARFQPWLSSSPVFDPRSTASAGPAPANGLDADGTPGTAPVPYYSSPDVVPGGEEMYALPPGQRDYMIPAPLPMGQSERNAGERQYLVPGAPLHQGEYLVPGAPVNGTAAVPEYASLATDHETYGPPKLQRRLTQQLDEQA
jgi:hypothetical protein